ncbi:cenpe protein [Capsaspora owczarzaki ATCC 30864]|uniref:cenpe protein n=2 Tax=Capsaspora owczarzaki (strain ATCC 30864) TaxID=595528 RepID=UPI0003526187|nr:cenpe protein [Capsaspora owczarzaki ATCC 30864]|eukprot:XP_004344350.2 cenpe protein [Capsaspora owczarzaki ATCC 30864]
MDNINVTIRVRPLNSRELNGGQGQTWSLENNSIVQCNASGRPIPSSSYTFDRIFGANSKTRDVYDQVAANIVKSAMDGVNGTIFAYGQTSSGKTHTMKGSPSEPGLLPLAIDHVFTCIQKSQDREFLLRVSYIEIYNEIITDLLKPENTNLKIRENVSGEIFVSDISEEVVVSPNEILKLMERGESSRHVGETNMNEHSSRSHTIFRMIVESRDRVSAANSPERLSMDGAVLVSSLNLVDLAGSERVGHTGAEGVRLKEGGFINKSLLTLGTVIGKLSDGVNESGHIPYRDSKLTRILQPSLGGNARTAIVCTITPATVHCDETISTLKFATRAKTIRNKPVINEVISDEALLKRYRTEISELKRMLTDKRDPQDTPAVTAELAELQNERQKMQETLIEREREKQLQQDKIDKLTRLILVSSTNSIASTVESLDTHARLDETLPFPTKANKSRRETWWAGAKRLDVRSANAAPTAPHPGSATATTAQRVVNESADISFSSASYSRTDDRRVSSIRMSSITAGRSAAQRVSIAPVAHDSQRSQQHAQAKQVRSKQMQPEMPPPEQAQDKVAALEMELHEAREQIRSMEELLEQTNEQLQLQLENSPPANANAADSTQNLAILSRLATLETEKAELVRQHEIQLRTLAENEDFVRNENQALVEILATLEQQVVELQKEKLAFSEAQVMHQQQQQQQQQLQQQHDEQLQQIEMLQKQQQEAAEQLAREFDEKLALAKREHNTQLANAEAQIQSLEQDLAAAASAVPSSEPVSNSAEIDTVTADFEAKIATLQAEHNELHQHMLAEHDQLDQEVQELHLRVQQLETEAAEKDHHAESLMVDLEKQTILQERIELQAEEAERAAAAKLCELEQAQAAALAEVQALASQRQARCEALTQQLAEAQVELASKSMQDQDTNHAAMELAAELETKLSAALVQLTQTGVERDAATTRAAELEQILSKACNDQAELEAQLKQADSEAESHADRMASLVQELETAQAEVALLKEEQQSVQSNLEQALQSQLADAQDKLALAQSTVEELKQQLASVDTAHAALLEEVVTLQEQTAAQADSTSESQEQLKQQLAKAEANLSEVQTALNESVLQKASLQTALDNTKASLQNNKQTVCELQAELELLNGSLASFHDESDTEFARLQAELSGATERANAKEAAVADALARVEQANLDRDRTLAELGELQALMATQSATLVSAEVVESMQRQLARSTAIAAEHESACRDLQGQVFAMRDEIRNKTLELDVLQTEKEQYVAQAVSATQRNEVLEAQLAQAQTLSAELEGRLSDASEDALKLTEQARVAQSSLETAFSDLEETRAQLQSTTADLEALQQDYAACEAALIAQRSAAQSRSADVEAILAEKSQLEALIAKGRTHVEGLTARLNSATQQLQERSSASSSAIDALQADIEGLASKLDQVNAEHATTQEQLHQALDQCEAAVAAEASLRAEQLAQLDALRQVHSTELAGVKADASALLDAAKQQHAEEVAKLQHQAQEALCYADSVQARLELAERDSSEIANAAVVLEKEAIAARQEAATIRQAHTALAARWAEIEKRQQSMVASAVQTDAPRPRNLTASAVFTDAVVDFGCDRSATPAPATHAPSPRGLDYKTSMTSSPTPIPGSAAVGSTVLASTASLCSPSSSQSQPVALTSSSLASKAELPGNSKPIEVSSEPVCDPVAAESTADLPTSDVEMSAEVAGWSSPSTSTSTASPAPAANVPVKAALKSASSATGGPKQVKFAETATATTEDNELLVQPLASDKENDQSDQLDSMSSFAASDKSALEADSALHSGFAALLSGSSSASVLDAKCVSSNSTSGSLSHLRSFSTAPSLAVAGTGLLRASNRMRPLVASSRKSTAIVAGDVNLDMTVSDGRAPLPAATATPAAAASFGLPATPAIEQPGDCAQQ